MDSPSRTQLGRISGIGGSNYAVPSASRINSRNGIGTNYIVTPVVRLNIRSRINFGADL